MIAPKFWISVGSLLLAVAVGCGAFGAHALRSRLDSYALGIWEKAVFYHFIHAIALLLVSLFASISVIPPAALRPLGMLFFCGVIIFSGSLYILALSGQRWLGALTPFGGTMFIIAWLWLALATLKSQ